MVKCTFNKPAVLLITKKTSIDCVFVNFILHIARYYNYKIIIYCTIY